MIIVSIISLLISTLLQGIVSNYIGYNFNNLSWLLTIYPLINILILSPYFENKIKNIILIIVFGLLTDIVYGNTLILNTSIFLACFFISKSFHSLLPYNLLTINISNLLNVFIYHIINFLLLIALRYDNYTWRILLKLTSHSIIMTIIYSSILYLLIEYIYKKFELKEVK